MNSVLLLTMRRLRWPLIVLVGVYAVGMAGLVLIPGVDANGEPTLGSVRGVDVDGAFAIHIPRRAAEARLWPRLRYRLQQRLDPATSRARN